MTNTTGTCDWSFKTIYLDDNRTIIIASCSNCKEHIDTALAMLEMELQGKTIN